MDTTPITRLDTPSPAVRSYRRHWRGVVLGAFRASITDRMSLAAAGCAFYATLALFPAISLLIAVYGYYSTKPAMDTTTTALIVPGQSTRW